MLIFSGKIYVCVFIQKKKRLAFHMAFAQDIFSDSTPRNFPASSDSEGFDLMTI